MILLRSDFGLAALLLDTSNSRYVYSNQSLTLTLAASVC